MSEQKTVYEACGCPAKPGEPCPLSETECYQRVEASLTDAERAEVARRVDAECEAVRRASECVPVFSPGDLRARIEQLRKPSDTPMEWARLDAYNEALDDVLAIVKAAQE